MNANDTQVGGSHYKARDGVQHWDLMIQLGVPYTIACATKYIWRWRDKNGLEDLRKAVHYIQKTIECVDGISNTDNSLPLLYRSSIPSTVGLREVIIIEMLINAFHGDAARPRLEKALQLTLDLIAANTEDPDVYAPAARRVFEEGQPTASQLHPG